MWNDLLLRLRSLFRRKTVEAEIDEELRFHFEEQVSKFIHSGLPPEEAKRRARLRMNCRAAMKPIRKKSSFPRFADQRRR